MQPIVEKMLKKFCMWRSRLVKELNKFVELTIGCSVEEMQATLVKSKGIIAVAKLV